MVFFHLQSDSLFMAAAADARLLEAKASILNHGRQTLLEGKFSFNSKKTQLNHLTTMNFRNNEHVPTLVRKSMFKSPVLKYIFSLKY